MYYYVYILTNSNHHVLYTGITNNLIRRIYEHKHHVVDGFTKRYHVDQLIYFEQTTDVYAAIAREKQVKGWTRAKKVKLITDQNPSWKDLYSEIIQ
ncbi:GIY-YIG nuclease family protein [Butyricicoccus faecihominis]|uniref:GIY-YIG nuclease family protein n=1 Tax=Butyricicoccus faecihominis TaxID=1712515 RepID=UPI0024788178|nr:GIY-YIG nuclease family protein [Butyricicoccus faecihominis]MCQ5129451.1 GIY-YIG nuclease family protein [Butyricicoccus faecihominis]